MSEQSSIGQDSWYSFPGAECDVVLSSRVRLSRNLADFVFPQFLKPEDAERVQSLVFDSFAHFENGEDFQSLRSANLDALGQKILSERGMFSYQMYALPWTGGVVRSDGRFTCSVNYIDHLRLASFVPGFGCKQAYNMVKQIDDQLQNKLQFAASAEFGYLCPRIADLGSGMKMSAVIHLPSLLMTRAGAKLLREIADMGYSFSAFLGTNASEIPCGSYYLVKNRNSFAGTEEEQIERFNSAILRLAEYERGATMTVAEANSTRVKDTIYRTVAILKYGRLISNREGIEIVSKIKWGLNLGLVTGVEHSELTALLYRIQNAHLTYVIRNGTFEFEYDITSEECKIERLRALVLQEALSNVTLVL